MRVPCPLVLALERRDGLASGLFAIVEALLCRLQELCGGWFGEGRNQGAVFLQESARDLDGLETSEQAVGHLGEIAFLVVPPQTRHGTPRAVVVQEDEMPRGWIQAEVTENEIAMGETRLVETGGLGGKEANEFIRGVAWLVP